MARDVKAWRAESMELAKDLRIHAVDAKTMTRLLGREFIDSQEVRPFSSFI